MMSRKIISIILAAALALGSATVSTTFAADNPSSGPSTGIDIPNMSELTYNWNYADVTASATVGSEALADDKVILRAEDHTVTVIVPDNNTAAVNVTVSCPATASDNTTRQLTGTYENVQKEAWISLMDGEKYTQTPDFRVMIVEESNYVPHTLNISVEGVPKRLTAHIFLPPKECRQTVVKV